MVASAAETVHAEPHSSADDPLLYETIVCDVEWSALAVGALSMLLSAAARPGAIWTLHPSRHLLYGDAKAILLALRYGTNVGVPADAVAKLNRLYGEISAAKLQLVALAAPEVYDRAQRASLPKHGEVWRRLAGDASNAIEALEPSIRDRLNETYARDAATLRHFLTEAARGDCRAVDEGGKIKLPKLSQRRRTPRAVVDRPCEVILPSGKFGARLNDVSRNGLGIVCDGPLAEGQSLVVALPDGRRMEATIVRRYGANAGLSLRQALAATDPLFCS
jgi:hypothetical protein